MTASISIVEFVKDPQLLGLSLSPAQETLLRAIYGQPLSPEQFDIWRACTGRDRYPGKPFGEVTVLAGARGGKDSRIAAPIVCYEATLGGHDKHLSRGERGVIPLVAQDARAAGVAFGYVSGYLQDSPLLRGQIEGAPLTSEIRLTNRLSITTFPCTNASLRGWSMPVGVMDEVAFYRLEGRATSDVEIQASIRRGGLSFPTQRLVKISTPYLAAGLLYDDFKAAWAKDDPDRLVWRASSRQMNPTLTAERLERERRLDPVRYAREYEAEFDADLSSLLEPSAIDACTAQGRYELPPDPSTWYTAFCDPSGGKNDPFTLAIGFRRPGVREAHGPSAGDLALRAGVLDLKAAGRRAQAYFREQAESLSPGPDVVPLPSGTLVVSLLRAWTPPFNPSEVVADIARILRTYRVTTVSGDAYGGEWPREQFALHGIVYALCQEDRSRLYLDHLLPAVNTGAVELVDSAELVKELRGLERRRGSSGRDRVDHRHGAHDDRANAVAGLLSLLPPWVEGRSHPPPPTAPPSTVQEIFNARVASMVHPTPRRRSRRGGW